MARTKQTARKCYIKQKGPRPPLVAQSLKKAHIKKDKKNLGLNGQPDQSS